MKIFSLSAILFLAAAAGLLCGQAGSKVQFDAASLKPSGSQSVRMERRDPEMFSFSGATLWDLLFKAWHLVDYEKQIVGPAWLRSDSFDVMTRFPQGTVEADFRAMLRNLLMERFGLIVHTETRDLPVYALVVGKGGSRLSEPVVETVKGDDCFPALPPSEPGMAKQYSSGGRICLAAHQESIAALVQMLRSEVDRPIVDRTALTGKYDVALEFSRPFSNQSEAPEQADIFTAVQRLGLRLERSKAPFELLVVDHADRRPLPN